ncbi:hypothetical protein C8A00DRAFT_39382 [Chaetomidium leptoderma]|uniref:MYND-type domain-containing protein n=1 Tax=Chaetomidium leptoderma TaxID=669021 RepID=A0AAN7A1V6_9PEZI|nr:hypothetical protein C8A00DRAFT_39382 [Chaetomidium leptoderma]
MVRASLTKCARCGADATSWCAGCVDAPEYQPGDAASVVYCGRDCQKDHWPDHKARCRAMRQRHKLLQAAKILKRAFLTYREVVFDLDLTKIEFRDGILYLHQKPTVRRKRCIFPSHLVNNPEHREAALANNQCTTAIALLGRLTRKLLSGVASTIEMMDINIGKPLVPTKLIPNPSGLDSRDCPHTVLRVRRADETWILDTTGCQYGFRDVLIPYQKYLADKECRIVNEPTTYDATETKDLDFFSTLPFMNRTRCQREDRELERRARLHFAVFVDTRVSKDMLDGSAAEIKAASDGFADELKSHMVDFTK